MRWPMQCVLVSARGSPYLPLSVFMGAITSGSGISGATLSGCTSTTMAGVAQFSGCQINDVGHGYSLTATDANDGGLTAVSGVFDVADAPFPFPDANLSYPNGAIVSFSGSDYVFAGGRRRSHLLDERAGSRPKG